ncbi:hypothetical protein [Thalassolituus sp.]|uniref:hypothetical protein n=1 Tax=Thalassolituus sp. TaxID=2030822 RepID=UPI003514DCB9
MKQFALLVVLLCVVHSYQAIANNQAEDVSAIKFLKTVAENTGLNVNYDPAIYKERLSQPGEMNQEQALRFLSKRFNVISHYENGELHTIDILPTGKADRSGLKPINMSSSSDTISTGRYSHPNWDSLSAKEKAALIKQASDNRRENMIQRAKAQGNELQKPVVDHLRNMKANNPERYNKIKHRYGAEILLQVENTPED